MSGVFIEVVETSVPSLIEVDSANPLLPPTVEVVAGIDSIELIEVPEDNGATIVEVLIEGPEGPPGPVGPTGVVVLNSTDPDPALPIDGVLYVRKIA